MGFFGLWFFIFLVTSEWHNIYRIGKRCFALVYGSFINRYNVYIKMGANQLG